MPKKKAVLYARLSVSTGESVSIERQLESGRKYAESRGWEIVQEFTDDGVSATKVRPEDREGWKALLREPEKYDVAVIWKVDRLARRVIDFLHADSDLQARGAGIVAVEDPIDMTTAQGRAFATLLAVFGELEAAAISARVAAARTQLLKNGRVVGGLLPYGFRSITNPEGPGRVLAHDPTQIAWVREIVARAQRGESLYSIAKWLEQERVPVPSWKGVPFVLAGEWKHGTVRAILKNPLLAGQITFNPKNSGKRRGEDVLRDERGLPVVYEDLAILSQSDWRALVAMLDARNQDRPKAHAIDSDSSGLLSGLIYCGDPRHEEPPRMWRRSKSFYCADCHQLISHLEDVLIEEFLRSKGDWMRWSKVTEVFEGGAEELPAVEHRLTELDDLIREATDRDQREILRSQQDELFDLRDELRRMPGTVVDRWNEDDATFAELWYRTEDVIERRKILEDALDRVVVKRGRPGQRSRQSVLARLEIDWKRPDETGPRPLEP